MSDRRLIYINKVVRVLAVLFTCCLSLMTVSAQRFFNLTADEVKIDSVLPVFNYAHELGYDYADSTYSVTIAYPEFIPMSAVDIERYQRISGRPLGELPEIVQQMSVSRKKGTLHVAFVPIVFRNGQYQKLVSFMVEVKGKKEDVRGERHSAISHRTSAVASERYAANSVLASGRWVKIGVTATGIWQLTDQLIREAGFSDPSRVKIYGYGGALQPEKLTADYLAETDDLKELPTCYVDGKRLFYGVGPVSWEDRKSVV